MKNNTEQSSDLLVRRDQWGDVVVLAMNLPPVNRMSLSLRVALDNALTSVEQDDRIKAVVLMGAGKLFSAGADVSEFASGVALQSPNLRDLCNRLDSFSKLTVAAVHGSAFGGALELALACDYRLLECNSKVGLPEVTLGIIPGAGATQRLPRLTGISAALDVMVKGRPVKADEALRLNIVDQVTTSDNVIDKQSFRAAALAYTQSLLAQRAPLRHCADMACAIEEKDQRRLSEWRLQLDANPEQNLAALKCVDAVESSALMPLAQGLNNESLIVDQLAQSPQARALQHIFWAEREAGRIPGLTTNNQEQLPIRSVAVVGSGTMGTGIAINFIEANLPTRLLDTSTEAVENGWLRVLNHYQRQRKKGRLTAEQVHQKMALLTKCTHYQELAESDLVVEAVFENIEVKRSVFSALAEACRPDAILASNTSTLNLNDLAEHSGRSAQVIGLHFFSPAHIMKLLEVVRGEQTSDQVLLTCLQLAKRINKTPVVSGVCWGFIGNRMIEVWGRESYRLILEGATPKQIDSAQQAFGLAMGFLSMIDMAGIDVGVHARASNRSNLYDRDSTYAAIADVLYEQGHYGQKTGKGFYAYRDKQAIENESVLTVARSLADAHGIEQRNICEQEIQERCLFALINEGYRVLEDEIAYRASDIDVIYCQGFGFPRWRGGPMHYAREVGLPYVLQRLRHYQHALGKYGETWFQPSAKLVAEAEALERNTLVSS